ncbi:MAG: beta-lactamase family protein [Firmicutes bacterium]|nr:beta-lactamase family protein [Bacillota bacterium]
MKSIPRPARTVLKLRLRLMPPAKDLASALAPYSPVGYSAAAAGRGEAPFFACGGDAVIGETRENSVPVRQDTIFRVASISKVLGAAAALRLVRQGKLALDGDIAEVLGFSAGRPVTLRQLLTHTAALSDAPLYDTVLFTPEAMPLDTLLPRSFLPYAPGTRFAYSNLGAGVVGMLIEAATGMLFDDFIRQTFFAPLSIDASFHPQRIVRKDRMANCYRVPGRRLAYEAAAIAAQPLDETPNPRAHYNVPAGKLMISAPDLLRIFQALPETDPDLFVRQNRIGSVMCDAGRGLGVACAEAGVFAQGREFWGHQGTAYGALCEAWMDIKNGTTAVLLLNGARLNAIGPLYRAGQSGIKALLDQVGKRKTG